MAEFPIVGEWRQVSVINDSVQLTLDDHVASYAPHTTPLRLCSVKPMEFLVTVRVNLVVLLDFNSQATRCRVS